MKPAYSSTLNRALVLIYDSIRLTVLGITIGTFLCLVIGCFAYASFQNTIVPKHVKVVQASDLSTVSVEPPQNHDKKEVEKEL